MSSSLRRNAPSPLTSIDEIQDILSVSKTTAYNLANSGEFRCVRVGGQYRISKRSFDKWLDALDNSVDECQVCE
jgi:excisionase family DNA binding protein